MSEAAETPKIRLAPGELHIEFARLFGPGGEGEARRFLRRAFAFPEVRAVQLEPGKAAVRFQAGQDGQKAFLAKLAAALGGEGGSLDEAALPVWNSAAPAGLHRFGGIVSTFEIAQPGTGRLQLRHAAISRDAALARRLEDTAKAFPGVKEASATASKGRLWISHAPEATDVLSLVRALEAQLAAPRGSALAAADLGAPAKMGLANATLGLAALGEFAAVPVVLPVCVGMLVATNLPTIRDAGKQLGKGKVGLPVMYTALLACSITTGQIVAHALMEWSFRFWARRSDRLLAEECRATLEDTLAIPAEARLVRSDEVDALVPSAELKPGDRVRLEAPAAIPADGRVVDGHALIAQAGVGGRRPTARVAFGDEVLAGGALLAGGVEIEVLRAGADTQAAQIAGQLIDGARGLAFDPYLRSQADAMADRAAPPIMAIAGVGWLVGGLITVGAVLHQDHASGPKLAVPLQTLRDMGLALQNGVVVRRGGALPRLAQSRFAVLEDHPALAEPALELEAVHSRLAESETGKLLRYAAGAGLYLGDERAEALADACQAQGLIVRQPPLLELEAGRLSVRQGEHVLALREAPAGGKHSLKIEIDGEEVARLDFRQGALPRAARAVQQLRAQGKQVFLLSGRPEAEAENLARLLGADLHGGDFSAEEKLRFLQGLKKRGVLPAYIGFGPLDPALAGEAHLAVSLGASALADAAADIAVPGGSLAAFAQVDELALGHGARIEAACRRALGPNILCIVGGYAGLLNGITSGLIANLGVGNVYRQAKRSLREGKAPAIPRGVQA